MFLIMIVSPVRVRTLPIIDSREIWMALANLAKLNI